MEQRSGNVTNFGQARDTRPMSTCRTRESEPTDQSLARNFFVDKHGHRRTGSKAAKSVKDLVLRSLSIIMTPRECSGLDQSGPNRCSGILVSSEPSRPKNMSGRCHISNTHNQDSGSAMHDASSVSWIWLLDTDTHNCRVDCRPLIRYGGRGEGR